MLFWVTHVIFVAEILGGIVIFYFIHHYLIIDSSTSIMLDVELLISEVQSNPCLWDMSDKEYNNREVKKKTWYQIAKNIFSNWEDIQIGEQKEKRK